MSKKGWASWNEQSPFHCNREHGLGGVGVNTTPNPILPLHPLSFPIKCHAHQRAPLEDVRVGAALDFLGVVEVYITLDTAHFLT
jgi:hypothetical protein